MNDPELDEIFTDPAHQEVVDLLKASRPAEPPLDPHFRSYLRAKLMTEARRTLPARARRSWFSFSPRMLAPAMAAVAAGFLVVLGIEVYLHNQSVPGGNVVAVRLENINNKTDVATAEPIRIPFSGPVDKAAVEESVQIEPATSVTKQWDGSTLIIIPDHQLAPNTTYTVSLRPSAAPPAVPGIRPTPRTSVPPAPVVVHFTTVRAPITTVVPSSYNSSSIGFVADNRLADSRTILNGTWTAAGQLLVTRPTGQPGPTAASQTPTATTAKSAASDVWLMSAGGTPLRLVAPGATLPATPSTGTGNMFAAWTLLSGSQARLDVFDLQGNLISSVATVNGAPERPAVWVGTDRLAYIDGGILHVVDIHGTLIALSTPIKVDHGSLAASPSGTLVAVESSEGAVFVDLTKTPPSVTSLLHPTATGFAWSLKGDLAFLVQSNSGSDLYVAPEGQAASKIASSPAGQTWSDLNWAPDGTSLLLATRPSGSTSAVSSLLVINRDGSDPKAFGASQLEYAAPHWSPSGDLVLFSRHDEGGGTAFFTSSVSTTGTNTAEQAALTEVTTFVQARIAGDSSSAQAQLDDNARAKYDAGASSLLSPAGSQYDRYYPVTVQLESNNPSTFLVGVRIFSKSGGSETSFFEEQLTVVQQGQRYLIHDVKAAPTMQLGHGPTVVSVEVVQTPPGQQVLVRFDADLKPETVTNETIRIKDGDGNVVNAQVTFDATNHLATLSVKLRPGTYQLVVTTGVTDINGTALAQEYDAPLVISR